MTAFAGEDKLRTSVTKELMSQKNPCVTGRLRRTRDVIYGVDSNAQERIQHANQEQASVVQESRRVPTDSIIYVSWPTEGKASWITAYTGRKPAVQW